MLNKLAYSQCVWYGCSFRLAPFEMFSYKANKYPTSTFWFLAPHCLRVVDSLSSPPDGSINRIPCELCHWRSLGKGKSGKCRTTELRQSTENTHSDQHCLTFDIAISPSTSLWNERVLKANLKPTSNTAIFSHSWCILGIWNGHARMVKAA